MLPALRRDHGLAFTNCPVCNKPLQVENKRRTDTLSLRAAGHAVITGSGLLRVRGVAYAVHHKPGRPDSVQIKYHVDGFRFRTVSEWLCAWHPGTAGAQARQEWRQRLKAGASCSNSE